MEQCLRSQKYKKCITLSSNETEYIITIETCKEFLWMKKCLEILRFKEKKVYFIL